MTDLLDRRRSVTSDDFLEGPPNAASGGVWQWIVVDPGPLRSAAPSLPAPSLATWAADRILAATLSLEDMWAGVINQAVTKLAVRDFEVSDSNDSGRRIRQSQDLVMNFDGPTDYRSGLNKTAQDFLTCRGGCFIEVERVSKARGSKIRALWHLDAHRCRRTGIADYPVIYWDLMGRWHALRDDQVIYFADMPSPRAELYGVGRPAAERAFLTIIKLAAVETYFREKITGARALKLVFLSGAGINDKKIKQAIETSDEAMERKGNVVYKGAVVIPTGDERPVTIAEVDLAGVADGFNVADERRDAYLRYANAAGIPVQDVQPLSGQGLGTGTQTVVLDEAGEGRGIAYFSKTLEDKLNWQVMPKSTTFQFKTNDLRDQKAKADLDQVRANTILALKGTPTAPGILSDAQALNMAADEGIVPKEFLPQDITPEGTATSSGDQSKPVEGGTAAGIDIPGVVAQAVEAATAKNGPGERYVVVEVADKNAPGATRPHTMMSYKDSVDDEGDSEWQEALKWAREVQR